MARYIVHFADLANFDTMTNFREACAYAKGGARDHSGASVYADGGGEIIGYHGDVLASWDHNGRKLVTGSNASAAARILSKLGASKGGKATAAKMTTPQRLARAYAAATARWAAVRAAKAAKDKEQGK